MTAGSSQSEPASRSFVFMLRQLERDRRYVPPYQQPTPVTPFAAAPPPSTAARPSGQYGEWVLDINDRGDLIARHSTGYEQVLAALPHTEGENDNG